MISIIRRMLSVSVTLVDGQHVAGTPAFLGANPAHVKQGAHKGLRVLGVEEDLARELMAALDDEQRKAAIISTDAPNTMSLPMSVISAAVSAGGRLARAVQIPHSVMPGNVRPLADQRDIVKILNARFPTWEDVFGPG